VITYSRYRRGYRDDGTIAALACFEGMASAHDLAIVGVFTLTAPTKTWGRRRRAATSLTRQCHWSRPT